MKTIEELSRITKEFGFNMKKLNAEDYKDEVVQTMWSTLVTLLQKKYYEEYTVSFDPFKDVIFSGVRKAHGTKLKEIQRETDKSKRSGASLSFKEYDKIVGLWVEDLKRHQDKISYHANNGLCREKSINANMLCCLDEWTRAIDMGKSVNAAYFDFLKAFDRVSRRYLLYNIRHFEIHDKFLR